MDKVKSVAGLLFHETAVEYIHPPSIHKGRRTHLHQSSSFSTSSILIPLYLTGIERETHAIATQGVFCFGIRLRGCSLHSTHRCASRCWRNANVRVTPPSFYSRLSSWLSIIVSRELVVMRADAGVEVLWTWSHDLRRGINMSLPAWCTRQRTPLLCWACMKGRQVMS